MIKNKWKNQLTKIFKPEHQIEQSKYQIEHIPEYIPDWKFSDWGIYQIENSQHTPDSEHIPDWTLLTILVTKLKRENSRSEKYSNNQKVPWDYLKFQCFPHKLFKTSCIFNKFMERMDKSNSALGKSYSRLKIILASSEITFLSSSKVFDGSPWRFNFEL